MLNVTNLHRIATKIKKAPSNKKMALAKSENKLLLNAFVKAAKIDQLRIFHSDGGWWVCSGNYLLMRPCGSTTFSSINEALGVLAGVGIRCSVVEWDGLRPITDDGRLISDSHVVDRFPTRAKENLNMPGMTKNRLLEEAVSAGFDPKVIEQAMFELYSHGYISYPYTHYGYLHISQANEAEDILAAVAFNAPGLGHITMNSNAPIYVSELSSAHHAIIPCMKNKRWSDSLDELAPMARETYMLIAKAYVDAISTM